MKSMIISEFKAKCIGVVKQVKRSKEPVLLTLRGEPVAVVGPVEARGKGRVLGGQPGAVEVTGDIVHADSASEWEMNTHPDRVLDPSQCRAGNS